MIYIHMRDFKFWSKPINVMVCVS